MIFSEIKLSSYYIGVCGGRGGRGTEKQKDYSAYLKSEFDQFVTYCSYTVYTKRPRIGLQHVARRVDVKTHTHTHTHTHTRIYRVVFMFVCTSPRCKAVRVAGCSRYYDDCKSIVWCVHVPVYMTRTCKRSGTPLTASHFYQHVAFVSDKPTADHCFVCVVDSLFTVVQNTSMSIYIYVCVCVCVCVCVLCTYTYIYTRTYIHLHTYIHTRPDLHMG